MRTRVYDAANVANIPGDAEIVLYYVDGAYVPPRGALDRFPHALKIGIAVFPDTNAGIVFDGPPDNSSWPRVVDWVVMRRRAGVDPTVYTDADQWPTAIATFRERGVALPHWWIAKWDGRAEMIDGAVAHQYAGDEHGGYDSNVAADYWPGAEPAPKPPPPPPVTHPAPPPPPPPPPPPVEDEEMIMVLVSNTPASQYGGGIYLVSGPMIAHMATPGDVTALAQQGVKQATISPATFQAMLAASAALKGTLAGQLQVSGALNVT